jgi:site-specific recombinase XerD
MTTPPPSNSRSGAPPRLLDLHASMVGRFVADRVTGRSAQSKALARSSARHFLRWLGDRHVPIEAIDDDVVARFGRHRCRCPRYSPRQLREPAYLSQVRRFVCFLEDEGAISVPGEPALVGTHVETFAQQLGALGYSRVTRLGYCAQARHFATWLRLSRIGGADIDGEVIERFADHDCGCPVTAKRGVRAPVTGSAHRRRGARRFAVYLQEIGAIPPLKEATGWLPEDVRLSAFRSWLERDHGATEATVRRYTGEASRWLPTLGADPARYTATVIRSLAIAQGATRSQASLRMTATVLRSFLRFTASRGACPAALAEAVPRPIRRRLAGLPRYAAPATIEAIIASCGTATPGDVRDRAIVLLLARMGLRASDLRNLCLADIDWRSGRMRLHGKQRRSVAMPLPQDAGEALLAYIEGSRPAVAEQHVFLRVQAPFTPFRSASEIAGIVARVLKRGGFTDVPSGAHMFRHSLATGLLRAGSNLDVIGTILRHRWPGTTAIYAKVDVAMLTQVAQPWPGDVPC